MYAGSKLYNFFITINYLSKTVKHVPLLLMQSDNKIYEIQFLKSDKLSTLKCLWTKSFFHSIMSFQFLVEFCKEHSLIPAWRMSSTKYSLSFTLFSFCLILCNEILGLTNRFHYLMQFFPYIIHFTNQLFCLSHCLS